MMIGQIGPILVKSFLVIVAIFIVLFFFATDFLLRVLTWMNVEMTRFNSDITAIGAEKTMGKSWRSIIFGDKKK